MEAPICALVDAMFRLPAKLDRLLVRNDHMLPRGAEGEIPLIKQDLEKMISILQEHDDSGAEDRAMMINCLIKEVRELSYDMEDSVDQYEHAADTSRWILSPHRKKYKITRCRGKIARRLPEKLKWRLWMANKIREFSMRSQEALQRYSLFNHPGGNVISSSTASTSIRCAPPFGSWHATPYGVPVGINTPLKKLEAWLDKDGEQKLKVVSLVGPGGIGKTMLANELYRRIGGQFECRAFVRTSRKPDVRGLLISMLSQVRPHQTPHTWKVHNLIADIRTHLQDKRYLIAIDDVWDTQTWDIISHALPDGNHCSGILVTTEIEDVSLKCCGFDSKYVFIMKSLGHDNSSKLFFNTTFGPKYQCPPELSEVANNIIRKCAGLPLAAVTVASLLVKWMDKPEQWDYVNKSLGYGLMTNPTLEGMKQVLNLSYNNLPQHLKACVMYLSIYQEDDIIQTDDLVKQWIAEGFIRATEDKDKEEISKGYFDELISSRMIQPVHMNDNDDVLSCTVHYVVLDFVRHKSIEENFVTAIDHCQTTVRLADKVRRLSLHLGNAEATPPTNMRLSQVRTLAFFGVLKCLPSIVEFRLLQVLSLHLWGDDDNQSINFDLTRISELFRLRYLHVKCNVNLNVQQIKMRALQCLETLKIDARVSAVPSDIVHLPGLLHLGLPIETNLPNGIGHMTSLRTIRYFDLSLNSTENVQSLGELTNLQDLRLTCSTVPSCYLKSKMDTMGSILAKLSNLRSLTLEPSSIPDVRSSSMSISCDGLSIISSALVFLRRFEWLPHICTFSSLPQWIEHLDKLCILKIGVTELARNDVDVLIGLPALTVLSLYVRTKPAEKIVFNNTGFSVLKYFKFMCSVPWVEFETDAMPNLRKLKLGFDAHGADQHTTIPVGIEKLSGLKEISAKIGGAGADNPDRTAAELALSYAIKMHPARPTFNIQHVDCVFTARDDYNSGLQEEEQMTLQKQYKIIEEDSNEQHQVLQKDSREGASTNVHRSTAKGGKRQRNSRYTFTTKSEVDHLEDGYRWRKYGKKAVKNSPHTRSYYRCAMQDCMVKKRVERSLEDPTTVITTYEGQHTHPIPSVAALRGSTHLHHQHHGHPSMLPQMGGAGSLFGQSGIGGIDVLGGLPMTSTQGLAGSISSVASATAAALTPQSLQMQHFMAPNFRPPRDMALSFIHGSNSNIQPLTPRMLPRWSTQVKLSSLQDIEEHDDGFSWMKYGQKDILGSKYPRSYYQCKHRHTQGCQAMKQLQRTDGDPLLFDAMYVGNHTCTQVVNFPFPHGHEQSSLSSCFKDEGSAQRLEHMPPRMPKLKTRMRQVMQVKVGSVQDIGPPDDGFSWRKYGEKDKVLGSKYPRAYFKCVQKGCPARKQVQRTDIDPLLFDVVYEAEHTCAQSAHSLSQRRQEQSSDSVGVNASPATSQSQVTYEISGSVAGVRFMSPAASSGEATCEEASGSTSKVGLAAPNSCQAASGSGSTTTGSRLVSPAMSASQVTYEVVSGSMAGSWSAPDEADSRMDDLLDLDSPVDDYAEEFYLNPVHEDLDSGLRAPPNSPESLN